MIAFYDYHSKNLFKWVFFTVLIRLTLHIISKLILRLVGKKVRHVQHYNQFKYSFKSNHILFTHYMLIKSSAKAKNLFQSLCTCSLYRSEKNKILFNICNEFENILKTHFLINVIMKILRRAPTRLLNEAEERSAGLLNEGPHCYSN